MPLRALLLIVCTMLLSGQNTLADNGDVSASPNGGKRRVSIMFAHYSVGTQIVNGYCWDTRYNRNITETLDTMTVVGGADTADIVFHSYRLNADDVNAGLSDTLPGSGSNGCAFDRFTGFTYDLNPSSGNRMRIWNSNDGFGPLAYAGLLNNFFNVPDKENQTLWKMFRTHDTPSSFPNPVTEIDGYDLVIIKNPYACWAAMTQAQADSIRVLYQVLRDSIVAHPEINVALAFGTPLYIGRDYVYDSAQAKITYELATWFAGDAFFTHDDGMYRNIWKWEPYRELCEMAPVETRYFLKQEYFDGEAAGSHLSTLGADVAQKSLLRFIRETVGDLMGAEPADSDNDGVPDNSDNCPQTGNADQLDGDGDGVGNVCDNCPDVANPDQADSDDDGIGNACCCFDRGDFNRDGLLCDIGDLIFLMEYMFMSGESPLCLPEMDVEGSGGIPDISDLTFMISYMFNDGPPPASCPN